MLRVVVCAVTFAVAGSGFAPAIGSAPYDSGLDRDSDGIASESNT